MSVDDPRPSDPSPAAMAIIASLFRSAPPEPEPALDGGAVFRFVCGVASAAEESAVIRDAVRHVTARRRLVSLKRRAIELAAYPFGAAPIESDDDRRLLDGLRRTLATNLRMAQAPRANAPSIRWDEIRDRSTPESGAVSLLIAAIGASVVRSRARASFATTRSNGNVSSGFAIAPGVVGSLDVRSGEGGVLEATVTFSVDTDGAWNSVQGRNLVLGLADPAGGSAPLYSSPVQGTVWRAVLTEFADITGLDPSAVTAEDFHVGIESELRLTAPKRYLYATVPPELRREDVSTFSVELGAPPVIQGNVMTLDLRLPEAVRTLYRDASLEIWVGFGSTAQNVGAWNLATWPEGSRRIEIPLLDVPDGNIECGSILQVRLAPSVLM